MEKVIGGHTSHFSSKYLWNLLVMIENYLHNIAKLGGSILNQIKLMHGEKITFSYVKEKLENTFLAIKTKKYI